MVSQEPSLCEHLCTHLHRCALDALADVQAFLDTKHGGGNTRPSLRSLVVNQSLSSQRSALGEGSKLRCCVYGAEPSALASEPILCHAHCDGGLLTISPISPVPGLQIFDLETQSWRDVDRDHFTDCRSAVVFVGESLEAETSGLFRAAPHRVFGSERRGTPLQPRISFPYFLRGGCNLLRNQQAQRNAPLEPPVCFSKSFDPSSILPGLGSTLPPLYLKNFNGLSVLRPEVEVSSLEIRLEDTTQPSF